MKHASDTGSQFNKENTESGKEVRKLQSNMDTSELSLHEEEVPVVVVQEPVDVAVSE